MDVESDLSRQLQFDWCGACGHWQAVKRSCCEACGRAGDLQQRLASGRAVIHAVTVVARGPTHAFRSLEPYTIVLARTVEGPLLMGHGERGAAIGDHVSASTFEVADVSLLRFVNAGAGTTTGGDG
jgi:uncharacterized OB-fold protein